MPAGRKKVKRFVIDVNCYITLFINRETDWLLDYVIQNNIEIFIDDNLLVELARVLNYSKIKKLLPLDSFVYLNYVRLISTLIEPASFQVISPVPEDNYLYDIALSAHAKLLVTGEQALLHWENTPVETVSLSTFKKLFR